MYAPLFDNFSSSFNLKIPSFQNFPVKTPQGIFANVQKSKISHFLNGKNFTSLNACKNTLRSFLPRKLESSGRMEFSNYLKDGERLSNKTMHI